jgi:diketogulonate reductase-like aldo/keto reductase
MAMINRRELVLGAAAAGLAGKALAAGETRRPILRKIPSSGEELPVIGMGSSRTFDVGTDAAARAPLAAVLRELVAGGGTVIDSSPMYGRAEQVIGDLLREMKPKPKIFMATKVWTTGKDAGIAQMNQSFERMGVKSMDLMQVHNLQDWKTHLPVLREWKAAGRIRYIGMTTSVARQHADMEAVMRAEPLDFVQFNYSVGEREAEKTLLPLAREKGIATMINRPFMRAALFQRVAGRPLPGWAADIGCTSWAQVFLKWILGHPDVTCIIPASAKASNMKDDMGAGFGALPDQALRERIVTDVTG